MWCKDGRCNKSSIPKGIIIVSQSLKRWPTKAKEAPSPHEVRPTQLDANPVFQYLGDKKILNSVKNLEGKSCYLNQISSVSCVSKSPV